MQQKLQKMPALVKSEDTKQEETQPTEDLLGHPEFKATLEKAKQEVSKRKRQIVRKYQPWKHEGNAEGEKPKAVIKPRTEPTYNGAVYIGHIPHGFYEEQMKSFFSQFGRISRINIARSQKTGRSKGYAFVEFDHSEVSKVVAETMNNYLLFERLLKAAYIPPEKVHKGMFPEGKSYQDGFCPTIKRRIKQVKLQDELMTSEEIAKNRQRMKKGLKATLGKLKDLGIDYEPQVFDPSTEELGALGLVVKRKRVESEVEDEKEEPQPKKSKKSKKKNKQKTQQENVETKAVSDEEKKAEVKPRPFIAKKVKGTKNKPAEPASTPPEVVEPVVTALNAFTVGAKDVTAPAKEGKRRKPKKAKQQGIKTTASGTLPTSNQPTESVEASKSSPNESSTSEPAAKKKKKKNRKPKSNQNGASAKDDKAKTVPESAAATSAQNGTEKKKKRKKSGAKAAPAPEGN